MTKENRERLYKHLRDLEINYVAAPGRDHDLEKTDVLKKRAKENANEMLKKHPELKEFDTPAPKEKKETNAITIEETKTKSKGKK